MLLSEKDEDRFQKQKTLNSVHKDAEVERFSSYIKLLSPFYF